MSIFVVCFLIMVIIFLIKTLMVQSEKIIKLQNKLTYFEFQADFKKESGE